MRVSEKVQQALKATTATIGLHSKMSGRGKVRRDEARRGVPQARPAV